MTKFKCHQKSQVWRSRLEVFLEVPMEGPWQLPIVHKCGGLREIPGIVGVPEQDGAVVTLLLHVVNQPGQRLAGVGSFKFDSLGLLHADHSFHRFPGETAVSLARESMSDIDISLSECAFGE